MAHVAKGPGSVPWTLHVTSQTGSSFTKTEGGDKNSTINIIGDDVLGTFSSIDSPVIPAIVKGNTMYSPPAGSFSNANPQGYSVPSTPQNLTLTFSFKGAGTLTVDYIKFIPQ